MRASPCEAARDFVIFGDHLIEYPMNIRERSADGLDDLLQTFSALLLTGKRIKFHEILCDQVVRALESSLIDHFFNKQADHSFVVHGLLLLADDEQGHSVLGNRISKDAAAMAEVLLLPDVVQIGPIFEAYVSKVY